MKILTFSGIWCHQCRMMRPIIKAIKTENPSLPFIDTPFDDNPKLVEKYKIDIVPTILIIDEDEKEIDRLEGLQHKTLVLDLLTKYFDL